LEWLSYAGDYLYEKETKQILIVAILDGMGFAAVVYFDLR
jgi:hypothetical protein